LAIRSFKRSGAASTVPVIVRWRHSPLIPMTPSSRMKRLEKSAVKRSRVETGSKSSVRIADRPTTSIDNTTAEATSARNVRVVRSFSSSARSSVLTAHLP
jgi:hypothetical protein